MKEYYEKVVSWHKKPNYKRMILGAFLILFAIINFIFLFLSKGYFYLEDFKGMINIGLSYSDIYFMSIGGVVGLVTPLAIGAILLVLNAGEGKQIKYRRIK